MASFDLGPTFTTGMRLRQGIRSLATFDHKIPFPARFTTAVSPAVVQRWETLPPFDRLHMRNVADELHRLGCHQDTVLAGLLHDIGKPIRTSTVVRALHVMLNRTGPALARIVLSGKHAVPGTRTLRALKMHADVGADFLAAHHLPYRVVWLVRHHHSDRRDLDLLLLQAVDDRH